MVDDETAPSPANDEGLDVFSIPPPVERPGPWAMAGIVVLGVALLYLLVRLVGCTFGGSSLEFRLRVPEVAGVRDGAAVLYKGVRLGTVQSVNLDGRDLGVTLEIDRAHRGLVRTDARWGFSEPALTSGDRDVLLLDPGAGLAAPSGHAFDAAAPSWFSVFWRDALVAALGLGLLITLWKPVLLVLAPIVEMLTKPFR